jgi:hypothetical protein
MMDNLDCPTWVPLSVRTQAVRLVSNSTIVVEKELIRRLLADERMESVWTFLGKKCTASSSGCDLWPGIDPPDGMSDQDVAVALFFYYSCMYAHYKYLTVTAASWAKKCEKYLESAVRLQEEAELLRLRWFDYSEAMKHAAAIDAAIDFHKSRTKQHFGDTPRLVGRNQGNPRQRAYAVSMAGVTRTLFGKPVPQAIATVTNVALAEKVDVSMVKVSEWCRLSIRVRARFSANEF